MSILKVHISLRTSKLARLSVASLFRSGKQESPRKYKTWLKKLTGVNNDDPYKKVQILEVGLEKAPQHSTERQTAERQSARMPLIATQCIFCSFKIKC